MFQHSPAPVLPTLCLICLKVSVGTQTRLVEIVREMFFRRGYVRAGSRRCD